MFILSEDYWSIKDTPHKGRGVFAKKIIEPGTVIGDYLGILIPADDEDMHGPTYAMYYNEEAIIVPDDPSSIGAHIVNHSCMPNCDTYPYKGHTLLFALRKIFPEEELTFHYLIDPPADPSKPALMYPCRCGSLICHGTMNTNPEIQKKTTEFVQRVDSIDHTKELPVPFGQELPELSEYPTTISDDPVYDIFGSSVVPPLESDDQTIPDITSLRNIIRREGKIIRYNKIGITVLGMMEGLIIANK